MGQEQLVEEQAKVEVQIAGLNFLHTFLVADVSSPCILGSDFLAQACAVVDFDTCELRLQQEGTNAVTQLKPKLCDDQ